MDELLVIDIVCKTVEVALVVSTPILMTSLVVGVGVSIMQVATSIQDVTLTFVPKMIAVGAVGVVAGAWMISVLVEFATWVLHTIPEIVS